MRKSVLFFLFVFYSCENKKIDLITTSRPDSERQKVSYCHEVCPNTTDVLKRDFYQRDVLAFKNFSYKGIGQCRGMVIVEQKLGQLAFFDKSEKKCNFIPMSKSCFEEVKKSLALIKQFKVTSIKGFRDLYEFSSHPRVKEMLKSWVRYIPHKYYAVLGSIRDKSYSSQNLNVFFELVKRGLEGQRSYIALKGYSKNLSDHAVLLKEVSTFNGKKVICVEDSNIRSTDECSNYIFEEENRVYYAREYRKVEYLSYIKVLSDEDHRQEKYIESRYNYCVRKTQCI